MKKITYLLALLCILTFSWQSNAQTTCTDTFYATGYDSGPTVLTINAVDITCNGANTPTSMQLINVAGSLTSTYCSTSGGSWYGFNLSIDGGASTPVCAAELENTDITGFSTITITSQDNDAYSDTVTITIDVEVTYPTPTCQDPSGMSATSVTDATADLTWTASASGETAWNLEWNAGVDFTPGTGAESGSATAGPTPDYMATGLMSNTTYYIYYQADCGGGDNSSWVGPFVGTTLCSVLVPDYNADMSVNVPDSCWDEAGSGEVVDGPGSLGSSDWRQGTSYALGSSNAINLFSTTDREWLLSPTFDLSGGSYELVVNTAVTNWNSSTVDDTMGSDDEVQLLMTTDGGTTWTNLTTWNAANEPPVEGVDFIYDLTAQTGEVAFAIWASDGTVDDSEDYDFHVGKFIVRVPPSCTEPSDLEVSNVTTTSADLTWTENGSATMWNIEYLADADFTPGTGATGVVADTASGTPTYSATGLSPNTTYYIYYQADCGGGDTSAWVGPVLGETPCVAIDSFSENFDTVSTPDLPDCWSSIIDNGASSFATVTTSTSADNSAPNGVSLYNSSSVSTSNIMLVAPVLSNLNAGTHRLRFTARNSSSTQDIEVGTLSDPFDGSTFTVLQAVDLSTTHTEYAVDFSGYSGTDDYIAIRRLSTSTYTYVYLDDIVWEVTPVGPPSCSTISSPADMATGVNNMPTLSWSANIDATGYKLKIGTTDGGTEFLAETDLGDVLTYDVMTAMAYNTMYYVTLTPYNANGDAVSCTSTSFTTTANPNYGGGLDGTDPNNPNSGGYFFANSTPDASVAPSQPSYNWIDPVAAGHTEITSWTSGSDDDGYFTVPDIGFDFDFYGNTYRTSNVFINTNGAVLFGTGATETGSSASIPSTSNAENFIAGCWQDLDDRTDGMIYYGGTADRFVVTWWHYHDYADEAEYITFQIIMYATGNIVIQYNDVESSADELGDSGSTSTIYGDALIGIENLAGDKGIQYRNNGSGGPIFGSPLALGFTTDAATLTVETQNQISDFQYYPNPVTNNLTLRAQNNIQTIAVYNMLGQEVLRTAPNAVDSTVDMSALNSGAYFVRVTIDNISETIRIIKN